MSSKNAVVEYSVDGSTWIIISGTANSVTVSGGSRKTGEAFTADGDTPLIVSGKREPLEVTVKAVYTEDAAGTPHAFNGIRAEYVDGTGVAVRWSPTAYTLINQKRYTTSDTTNAAAVVCPITSFSYPALDFSSGDPIMIEFTVRCGAILTEDHAA